MSELAYWWHCLVAHVSFRQVARLTRRRTKLLDLSDEVQAAERRWVKRGAKAIHDMMLPKMRANSDARKRLVASQQAASEASSATHGVGCAASVTAASSLKLPSASAGGDFSAE